MTTPRSPDQWSTMPASDFSDGGAMAGLLKARLLGPPRRPGTIASLGEYDILDVLGIGGMGIVLRGRRAAGAEVAVKLLKPELATNPQAVRLFLKEAAHMKGMNHPGIARVLHVSADVKRPYFIMPFMRRGSLAGLMEPTRPAAKEFILDVARPIARALDYAHRKGIIHRDLKPANVLLDDQGGVCISDFGLARTVFNDSVLDVTRGQRLGTLPYMSPAVARGEAEDTRCDIYSFGAMLYELLTGCPPYEGPSREQIIEAIRARPPRPIREIAPKAPPDLVTVAEGAMARNLRDRYAQMSDIVADLDAIAEGRRPRGPARARPGAWKAISTIAAAAACVAIGLGFWLLRGRERERPPAPMPTIPTVAETVAPADRGVSVPTRPVYPEPPVPYPVEHMGEEPPRTAVRRVSGTVQDALKMAYSEKLGDTAPSATVEMMLQPGGASSPWIKLSNGDAVSSADNYRVLFTCDEPAHFYVFQIDSRGKLDWIFPRNEVEYSFGTNPVKPGTWVQLPEGDGAFQLDDAVGIEHIYVVATSKPWEALQKALAKATAAPSSGEKIETAFSLRTRGIASVRKTGPALPPEMAKGRSEVQEMIQGKDGVVVVERWFRHVLPQDARK